MALLPAGAWILCTSQSHDQQPVFATHSGSQSTISQRYIMKHSGPLPARSSVSYHRGSIIAHSRFTETDLEGVLLLRCIVGFIFSCSCRSSSSIAEQEHEGEEAEYPEISAARVERLETLIRLRKLYRNLLRADRLLLQPMPVYQAAKRPGVFHV